VPSPDANDEAHTSPRLQHSRPQLIPLAQQMPAVQKVPWRQQVASASGVATSPVTVATALAAAPNAAHTKAKGQQTPAATLPEMLAATEPPLTQRDPGGQHWPEQIIPPGQPPPAPAAAAAAAALGSLHLLPWQVLGGLQQVSAHV
jgi:hypothetical protein